jgi:hypothetical protein
MRNINDPALELIGIAKVPSRLPLSSPKFGNHQQPGRILGMSYAPVALGQAPSLI